MTSNASPSPSIRLRAPKPVFAALALAIFFVIGVSFAAWAGNGFGRFYPDAAIALSVAGLIGVGVLVLNVAKRLGQGAIKTFRELVIRAALAGAITGFVWPLSFGIAVALQNDVSAALSQIGASMAGLLIGAVAGALGGSVAAFACCERA